MQKDPYLRLPERLQGRRLFGYYLQAGHDAAPFGCRTHDFRSGDESFLRTVLLPADCCTFGTFNYLRTSRFSASYLLQADAGVILHLSDLALFHPLSEELVFCSLKSLFSAPVESRAFKLIATQLQEKRTNFAPQK